MGYLHDCVATNTLELPAPVRSSGLLCLGQTLKGCAVLHAAGKVAERGHDGELALAGRAGGLAGDAGGDHGRHIVYFGLRGVGFECLGCVGSLSEVSLYVSRSKRGDCLLRVVVSRDCSQMCLIVMLMMMIEKKGNTTRCDRSILILRDVHVDDILPGSKPAVSQPSGLDMIRCRNNYFRILFVYRPQTRTKLARKGANPA